MFRGGWTTRPWTHHPSGSGTSWRRFSSSSTKLEEKRRKFELRRRKLEEHVSGYAVGPPGGRSDGGQRWVALFWRSRQIGCQSESETRFSTFSNLFLLRRLHWASGSVLGIFALIVDQKGNQNIWKAPRLLAVLVVINFNSFCPSVSADITLAKLHKMRDQWPRKQSFLCN